jgi:hypothetical protein
LRKFTFAAFETLEFGSLLRALLVPANSSMTRLVTAGSMIALPSPTVRIAVTSCSAGESLKRKPLADAVEFGHSHVHQGDVRVQPTGGLHSGLAVRNLPDDVDIHLGGNDEP